MGELTSSLVKVKWWFGSVSVLREQVDMGHLYQLHCGGWPRTEHNLFCVVARLPSITSSGVSQMRKLP